MSLLRDVSSSCLADGGSGRLAAWAVLMLALAGCGSPSSPVDVLVAAQKAARANQMQAFAEQLSPASRAVFYLADTVGRRYGYLDDETFKFLALLEPGEVAYHDEVAELPVRSGNRQGTLCFVQVDGAWKLELLRVSPCLEEEPPLPGLPKLWGSAPEPTVIGSSALPGLKETP